MMVRAWESLGSVDSVVFLGPVLRPFLIIDDDDGDGDGDGEGSIIEAFSSIESLEGFLELPISLKGYRGELERLSEKVREARRKEEREEEKEKRNSKKKDKNNTNINTGIYVSEGFPFTSNQHPVYSSSNSNKGNNIYESGTSVQSTASSKSQELETKMLGDILDAVGVNVEGMNLGLGLNRGMDVVRQEAEEKEEKEEEEKEDAEEEEEEEEAEIDTIASPRLSDVSDATSTSSTTTLTPVPSATAIPNTEQHRLAKMTPYLSLASRHMMTKMQSWHNSRQQKEANESFSVGHSHSHSHSALHAESMATPISAAFPLSVPSQKFSELVVGGVRTAFPQEHVHRDIQSVLNGYGLLRMRETGGRGGGRKSWRIRVDGGGDGGDNGGDGVDGGGSSSSDNDRISEQSAVLNGNWLESVCCPPTSVELYKLLGRLRALDVP